MSTLSVDTIQGQTASSVVKIPNHVIQVKSVAKTDTFSSSSTSFTDVTGLSVAITPSSSSNKILVSVHLMSAATGANSPRFNLVRGSTNIAQPSEYSC